jgi:DNA polymerase II large subunit
MQEYFKQLIEGVKKEYAIAEEARRKGLDPISRVEIPIATNLAERATGLISMKYPQLKNEKIVSRINELEKEYGFLDPAVCLKIAEEIVKERFCKFKSFEEALDAGLRVAFAYFTLGVVSSPLEGYSNFEIKKTADNQNYICAYFSGPIRSAGTTATSLFVFLIDYLRTLFGYVEYDITEKEIRRSITEVYDYHEYITNLQYLPTEKELGFLLSKLPLQIDGTASEEREVSNYKDLPRISTNRLRNGVCLVLCESLCQKSHKLLKILKNLELKGFNIGKWGDFIEDLVSLQKKQSEKKTQESDAAVYIKDIVAGRPVLTHPSRAGGFRLRYGRCRISGDSSMAMHPATMQILKNFIATGTQLKYEGPGKSSAMVPCDSMDGPIVKLKNKSVVFLCNEELAKKYAKEIEEVIYLGDFLVNYGEFFNRGKKFQKPGYVEEWYSVELEKAAREKELGDFKEIVNSIIANPWNKISIEESIEISRRFGVPLHPKYIFYWSQINYEDFLALLDWLGHSRLAGKIILPYNRTEQERFQKGKRALELLGVSHEVITEDVVLNEEISKTLLTNLGISLEVLDKADLNGEIEKISKNIKGDNDKVLEIINKLSKFKIKDKAGSFIGARMGRPEKAKMRKLVGNPSVLFPVGEEGGRLRSVNAAVDAGSIKAEFPIYKCENCQKETIYFICEGCGGECKSLRYCPECEQKFSLEKCPEHQKSQNYMSKKIDSKYYFEKAIEYLGLKKEELPKLIKGVRGTSNAAHIPENLAKGILRSMAGLSVNKDGTIRYDITELSITHFRPKEIFTSVEKLRELGYKKDIYGKELENENQLVELKCQDIIIPCCPETEDEKADDVFMAVAKFIDLLLVKFYKMKPFFNLKKREDLVGQLVVGLAPHTSAGIIGRIIGFSKTIGLFAHPMWHSAQRRDCEGDETSILFLLDALLNGSREFLPNHRGATQDAILVISSKLIPNEIDDMAFDIDVVWRYPLELYEAAEQEKDPHEIKIEQLKHRLGTDKAYYDFGFTNDVSDINCGIRYSAYKSIETMQDKVKGQMEIAEMIRAVDTSDVARLVIDRHFIRDIKGNLRKFSQQEFRCSTCNTKYRRPPLAGKCLNCGGRLIFTISEGSIIKYLEPALYLAKKYNVSEYIKQNLELTKSYIEGIFGKEKEKQEALKKWF